MNFYNQLEQKIEMLNNEIHNFIYNRKLEKESLELKMKHNLLNTNQVIDLNPLNSSHINLNINEPPFKNIYDKNLTNAPINAINFNINNVCGYNENLVKNGVSTNSIYTRDFNNIDDSAFYCESNNNINNNENFANKQVIKESKNKNKYCDINDVNDYIQNKNIIINTLEFPYQFPERVILHSNSINLNYDMKLQTFQTFYNNHNENAEKFSI